MDIFRIFFWFVMGAIGLFPVFLVGWRIYRIIYREWRIRQADEVRLQEARLVRLEPDTHGLGGWVIGLPDGELVNLDSSDFEGKQKIIAALTGASFGSPVAKEIVNEGDTVIELPSIIEIPAPKAERGMDL